MNDRSFILPQREAGETGPYSHLGFATARPGHEDVVEAMILELAGSLLAEEGTIEFRVHRDRANRCDFVVYESYRSREDLERHLSTTLVQEFITRIEAHVEGPLRQQFLLGCESLPATADPK